MPHSYSFKDDCSQRRLSFRVRRLTTDASIRTELPPWHAAKVCDAAKIKTLIGGLTGKAKETCGALAATAGKWVACMDDEAVKDKKTCKAPADGERCACYSRITQAGDGRRRQKRPRFAPITGPRGVALDRSAVCAAAGPGGGVQLQVPPHPLRFHGTLSVAEVRQHRCVCGPTRVRGRVLGQSAPDTCVHRAAVAAVAAVADVAVVVVADWSAFRATFGACPCRSRDVQQRRRGRPRCDLRRD